MGDKDKGKAYPGFDGIPEARQEELRSLILAFVGSSSAEPLTIGATAFERKFVHSLASDLSLPTESRGEGVDRRLVVSKPAVTLTKPSDRTLPYAEALQARLRPLPDGFSSCVSSKSAEKAEGSIVVGRKKTGMVDLPLGEGSLRDEKFVEKLPTTATIQVMFEKRRFVTIQHNQMHAVYYTKDQVFMHSFDDDEDDSHGGHWLVHVGLFPLAPLWPAPPGAIRAGGPRCDVWHASVDLPVRGALQAHADLTYDRPIPRYQMIVDPNKFVSKGGTWIPMEVDVAADGSAQLVGGPWSHRHPVLAAEAALPVLRASLPLLSRLRRPQLLLDDRRIQVVFKAQRIIVPPKQDKASESEYVGLWHQDGDAEHVAAVVLYYYNVDSSLEGGDLEFCGREPLDILGVGDCSNNMRDFSGGRLGDFLRRNVDTQACRVPVKTGTLVAFSNYQMVHRVLRMINKSPEHEASRDFVALFVLDPAVPPAKPARCFLAEEHLWRQTLSACNMHGSKMPQLILQRVLEFLGVVSAEEALNRKRARLLKKQLQPRGRFGSTGEAIYATGNGCFTLIGWLDRMLEDEDASFEDCYTFEEFNPSGQRCLAGLNLSPRKMGRGLSEVLSLSSSNLRQRLNAQGGSGNGDRSSSSSSSHNDAAEA